LSRNTERLENYDTHDQLVREHDAVRDRTPEITLIESRAGTDPADSIGQRRSMA
jgi:hypothetical protein